MSSPRRAGAGGDPVEQGGAVETPGFADAAGARDLSGSEEAVEGVAGAAPVLAPQARSRTLTQITVTAESMEQRRHYLGLDSALLEILPSSTSASRSARRSGGGCAA
jgi:hypothetical protein